MQRFRQRHVLKQTGSSAEIVGAFDRVVPGCVAPVDRKAELRAGTAPTWLEGHRRDARTAPSAVHSRRVLGRVKGLVLAMLENRQAPIFCAWLRSRRASKRASPLTHPALPANLTAGRLQGMGLSVSPRNGRLVTTIVPNGDAAPLQGCCASAWLGAEWHSRNSNAQQPHRRWRLRP